MPIMLPGELRALIAMGNHRAAPSHTNTRSRGLIRQLSQPFDYTTTRVRGRRGNK